MHNYSLNPINVPAEEFLRAFFDLEDRVCLRVFDDKIDGVFQGKNLDCVLEGYSDVVEELEAHNAKNRGVFFVVNSGGHDDENINRINAQFVDMDMGEQDIQLIAAEVFELEPSIIVKTARGLHCYWLMKSGADVKRFRYIQRQLVKKFNGDPKCINLSRVLRIPGFYHCKDDPVLIECVKFNPELRYTQNQLSALPIVEEEPDHPSYSGKTGERGCESGLVMVGRECAFIQHCKKNAKTLSEPDWYAMITNLAVFEGSEDVIHKMSKPYPKYNYDRTEMKIEHFYKTGTKPMTCKKIAEGGFKCPRLGKCPVKAPAGLAFIPYPLKDLKKVLSTAKKAGDPVTDLQYARLFISDYLYNQEPGLAEPFIRYDLKNHFGFVNGDIRGLTTIYREAYRRFSELKNSAKKEKMDQAWYEIGRTGALRLMPGILADHLSKEFHAFYCTEQYYYYDNGVYTPRTDKDAKATVRTYLNPRDVTLNQINDVEGQWQLVIRKPIREVNPNAFKINVKNGIFDLLKQELYI